jgi:peptidoglycan/LPS O-acetylase OafA/YrhL
LARGRHLRHPGSTDRSASSSASLVTFGLAVLASWLLHRLVETPAMRALSPRRTIARTVA